MPAASFEVVPIASPSGWPNNSGCIYRPRSPATFLVRPECDTRWRNVVANPGDLPRNLTVWTTARDLEPVVFDLPSDIQIGRRFSDGSQLVAEVPVQGLEPVGHMDPGLKLALRVTLPVFPPPLRPDPAVTPVSKAAVVCTVASGNM